MWKIFTFQKSLLTDNIIMTTVICSILKHSGETGEQSFSVMLRGLPNNHRMMEYRLLWESRMLLMYYMEIGHLSCQLWGGLVTTLAAAKWDLATDKTVTEWSSEKTWRCRCRCYSQTCTVGDGVCVLCLTRTPGCQSSPRTRTTDRTSRLQTTLWPTRWKPFKPSLIWSYVSFPLLSSPLDKTKLLYFKLTCVFFPSFQTNDTKDVVCHFHTRFRSLSTVKLKVEGPW